jgi:HNH endonuclease
MGTASIAVLGVSSGMRARPNRPAIGRWILPVKRLAIHLRDDFRCLACGRDLTMADRATVLSLDHRVPVRHGGNNWDSNLYTCCQRCNRWRQDRPLSVFKASARARIRRHCRRKLGRHLRRAKLIVSHFGWGPP